MKFTLEINLDNDTMSTPADIASVMQHIADQLKDAEYSTDIPTMYLIRDVNGHTVGRWEVG